MKKLKTMTELDILESAWRHNLEVWSSVKEKLDEDPKDDFLKHWTGVYKSRMDELEEEIVRVARRETK